MIFLLGIDEIFRSKNFLSLHKSYWEPFFINIYWSIIRKYFQTHRENYNLIDFIRKSLFVMQNFFVDCKSFRKTNKKFFTAKQKSWTWTLSNLKVNVGEKFNGLKFLEFWSRKISKKNFSTKVKKFIDRKWKITIKKFKPKYFQKKILST